MQKYLFLGVAGLLILVSGWVIIGGLNQNNMQATIKTSLGEIKVELYDSDAPKTVANFVKLAKEGFYNGVIFHRVIPKFMIQGGDPFCAQNSSNDKGICGTGGPGYKFEDELNGRAESYKNGYKKGVLAMANAGPNTNGSQFFIMVDNVPLPHNYSIFGRVVLGQEVADKISLVKTSEGDRPVDAVVIETISILDPSN